MKKCLLTGTILLTILALPTLVSAQKFKEKLNSAKEKAKSKIESVSNGEKSSSASTGDYVHMAETAKVWETGEYETYGIDGIVISTGKKPIEITKDSDGLISEVKYDGDTYKSDATYDNPIVVAYHKDKSTYNLYFNDQGIAVYHYWKGTGGYEELSIKAFIGAKQKPKSVIKEIKEYRAWAKEKGAAAKEEYAAKSAAEAEAKEAERKKKYGLAERDVVKIEFVNFKVPEIFGHWSGGGLSGQLNGRNMSFDLKATLKDGSTISTEQPNTGYLSDYRITYDEKAWKYGQLETGWSDDDVLTITATCISNPSLTITKDIPIKYNQNIAYLRNGLRYGEDPGGPADNFKLEVKQVKHRKTGAPLLQYRLTNTSTGAVVDEAKIDPNYTLVLKCNGASGGVDNGTPQRGGNGGHILLVKDPSVEKIDFDYSNLGGEGGTGRYNSAPNGRTGTFKEKVQAVNF